MNKITLPILLGTSVSSACREAVEKAIDENCIVEFEFNDIKLEATPTTDPVDLIEYYDTETDKQHTAWLESPEFEAQQKERARKLEEQRAAYDAIMAEAPAEMALRNPEAWAKAKEQNDDTYGAGIMVYAERWARMMEALLGQGEQLSDIAEKTSRMADIDGITGFMYGCAVSILADVWEHGEALRQWHNLETQTGTEGEQANANGGVLNPALLVLEQKA